MNIWIFVTIITFLIVVVLLFKKPRQKVVGICTTALTARTKKEEKKEKILELLEDPSTSSRRGLGQGLSNSDVRKALGVSDRTVVRYMNELEKEGKVEQVGNTGHAVTYRLKT